MNKNICLTCLILLTSLFAYAQDEGNIVKRDRIQRDNGIFIGFGPSFTLGKNIGDYSTGISVEAGFLKRVNRILSIGPSISYLSFKYDPEVTTAKGGAYIGVGDPNDWGTKYGLDPFEYDYGYVLKLEGGDMNFLSLDINLKLNLIPVTDNSKFSIYGFAKPFLSFYSRGEVSGTGERYTYETFEDLQTSDEFDDLLYYDQGDETWYADGYIDKWGATTYPALESKSGVTYGIFLGPGFEFMPAKKVSVFAQASFGYTFPISFVSTESYGSSITDYVKKDFPMVEEGFSSISIQFGVSFNF